MGNPETEVVVDLVVKQRYRRIRILDENDSQNPIALQVGGSEPEDLAKCAKIASLLNYDEINLNVGCPSKAVQKGSFGACLMKDKLSLKNS